MPIQWPPTDEQIERAAKRIVEAQRTEVMNQILMVGINPTDEEMEKIERLIDLAIQSGNPTAFLSAVSHLTFKPLFVPCACWWCKLKRRLCKTHPKTP